ncbi:MAG TPA: bacteriohemerythrin [Anaeromyxobacteraceae bacterium]|nr:bacteriohemerythrin [Anaeromyxobacteraceae bacterium]
MQWTSALTVGVAEIDAQHQELFRRVDRLLDAMLANDRAEGERLVGFLLEYVKFHFADEEALMLRRRFPGLAAHQAEHAAFAVEVEKLAADFRARGATAALILALEREVCDWLRDHVYLSDVQLGKFVLAGRPEAR